MTNLNQYKLVKCYIVTFAIFLLTWHSNAQSFDVGGPAIIEYGQTGQFTIDNVVGVPSPYTANWSTSGTVTNPSISGATIEPNSYSSLSVTVTLTSSNGTVAFSGTTVPVRPPKPSPTPLKTYSDCVLSLKRISPPTGVTWYWQTSVSGVDVSDPAKAETFTPATNGAYYIRAKSNGSAGVWCNGATAIQVTLPSDPDDPIVAPSSDDEICKGGTAQFTISNDQGSSVIYKWYNSAGEPVGTGNSWSVTPGGSGSKTYTVKAEHTTTKCTSSSISVPLYIIDMPEPLDNSAITVCGDSGITLSAQNSKSINGTVRSGMIHRWYSNSNRTGEITSSTDASIPSGTLGSFIMVANQTKTYYVETEYDNCTSDLVSIQATAISNNLTGGEIDSGQTICNNTDPVNITSSSDPTGGNGSYTYTWQWSTTVDGDYDDIDNTNVKEYNPNTNLTVDRWYRRKAQSCNDAQEAFSNKSKITVHETISNPTVTSNERCGTGTVQLSAAPSTNADKIRWYSASTGGNPITTGVSSNTLTFTPSLSSSKTYYAESYDNDTGCFSSTRTAVVATVNSVPTIATANDPAAKCGSSKVAFEATPGNNANSIKWYTAASGGTLKHEGLSYLTPNNLPVGTTTYYAASYNTTTECEDSDRVAVTATINPVPTEDPTIEQITLASCSEANGSFVISNYDGALYTYDISPSTGVSQQGAAVNAPPAVYSIKAIAINGGCESGTATADINGFDGPNTPTPPTFSAVTPPGCATANGTFNIISYDTTTYTYEVTSSAGTVQPDANGKVVGPADTYIVTRREGNCTSADASIAIVAPSTTCGGNCSITSASPDPVNFTSASQNISLVLEGDTNCPLVVTAPTWINAQAQLDYKTITMISEVNTLGDMEDVIQIQQTGGQNITVNVFREHGPNYPGNPDAPTIDSNDCSGRTLLRPIKPSDEIWYWQGVNPQGMSDNEVFGSSKIVDASGTYYIRAFKNNNWSTKLAQITVTIKSVPADPILVVAQPLCSAELGTITVTNIGAQDQVSFNGGSSYELAGLSTKSGFNQGSYTIKVMSSDGCESAPALALVNQVPSNDCSSVSYSGDNYVYTRSYQKSAQEMSDEEAINQNNFDFFTASESVVQQITYFDGLGRPIQQIGIDQSPDVTGIGNFGDIITFMDYDDYGRMVKEYLPYATAGGVIDGSYRDDALSKTTNFYLDAKYENTANPFSEKAFEPSPLNRIEKQASPGNDWAMGNDHEIEFDYHANSTGEVRLFTVDLSAGNENSVLDEDGFYNMQELYKTIIKDENHTANSGKNHTTETFTNKQGRVVLKRTYADMVNNDGSVSAAESHDTYYVYDDFGNLTYVVPPLVNTSNGVSTTELSELCYQYKYDFRNRLVEKKIPGKGEEFIIYNKLDQSIMTQDANQRVANEWLFTKYDAFGRVAYTGIYSHGISSSRTVMQSAVDDHYLDANGDRNTVLMYEKRDDVNTSNHNYSNTTFPATNLEILTVNYYDTYVSGLNAAPIVFTPLGESSSVTVSSIKAKGLPTGSKVKVLDQSPAKWITSVSYYDDEAKPIYGYSENEYLQTTDVATVELDFIGKPLKTRTTHTRTTSAGSTTTIVTIDNFQYDQIGRLLAQTQCIGDATLGESCGDGSMTSIPVDPIIENMTSFNETKIASSSITVKNATLTAGSHLYIFDGNDIEGKQELIVFNTYDNLGQLENKKVGGLASAQIRHSSGLQKVDYNYNVRGWLAGINNDYRTNPNSNQVILMEEDDLFGFQINYNDPHTFNTNELATDLYNGNIAQVLWKTTSAIANANPISERYTYTYDALNRIKTGIDNTENYNLKNITYDKNGNIRTLERKGHINAAQTLFGLMDDLSYTYTGNQLQSVSDLESAQGFNDGNPSGLDYLYDANGNMTQDLNKGIKGATSIEKGISYNHLNLPTEVTINDGVTNSGTISYIYDASGVKLQKKVFINGNSIPTQTDYSGNYIYKKNKLQFFSTPEGYVEPKNPDNLSLGYDYIYQYKDHVGNVRLSYKNVGTTSNIDIEIQEENNYYPFGLKHKGYNTVVTSSNSALKYKYNGVEFEESLGLNIYEMEFRQYDPAIGKFTSIDPVTHFSQSTYAAFDNNPIYWADPSGNNSVNSVQDAWDATPENTNVVWNSNGIGGFCDDCPKEGQTRQIPGVQLGVDGPLNSVTQYYHSGGFDGSNANWHNEANYFDIFSLTIFQIGQGISSIESLNDFDFTDEVFEKMALWAIKSLEKYGGEKQMESGRLIPLSFLDIIPSKMGLKALKISKISKYAFWSGKGTQNAALNAGFKVLGQTRAGLNLAKLTKPMDYSIGSKAWKFWGRLSQAYARKIPKGGTINVFITQSNNANPMSIWNKFEKPILIQNKVKIKYNFVD